MSRRGVRHQQPGAEGQEQPPGAPTDGSQRAGAGERTAQALPVPKRDGKGPETTSVPGGREAVSSSGLARYRNNFWMAEEAGRSTEQVAGVQTGTEETLRASL